MRGALACGMTLSSQAPRPGQGRRYMASRRRRTPAAAKILALLAVVLALGLWWTLSDEVTGPDVPARNAGEIRRDARDQPKPDAEPDAHVTSPATPPARIVSPPVVARQASESRTTDRPPPPPRLDRALDAVGVLNPAIASPLSDSVSTISPAEGSASLPDASTPTALGSDAPETPAASPTRVVPGLDLIAAGRLLEGRAAVSDWLLSDAGVRPANAAAAAEARAALDTVNARLVFSPDAVAGDSITETHRVQPGDTLGALGRRFKVPYALLEYVNGIEANRLRAGAPLKLVRGPVHARVAAGQHVIDLFVIGRDGRPIYLTHFAVGLGSTADGNPGTPAGLYRVGGDKVINPSWRNPRTGEYFAADHPDNPIGEYWIPLVGLEGDAAEATGIGIHGTNEPDSIGRDQSMGCVRLGDADIARVFAMLYPNASEVRIVP